MDYEKFTLVELRQLAKEKGTKNVSKLKKDELIELLNKLDNESSKKSIDNYEDTIEAETKAKRDIKHYNNSEQLDEESIVRENTASNTNYKLTNEDDFIVEGILEVLPDGYGFLRGKNYLSSPKDVYISPVQIKRFRLDKGDKIKGIARTPKEGEKFPALIYVGEVNGEELNLMT